MDSLKEIQGFENSADAREIFRFGRNERQAPDGLEQAHFSECGFHWDGIGFDEVDVHQGKILEVEAAGFGEITRESGLHEASHLRGNFVGGDGDQAAAAERNQRKRQGVVAGDDEEILGNEIEDGAHLGDAAGGFLDADDVLDLGEAENGGRLDVDASAALNAVENDGYVDSRGDSFKVLEEAFLCGLVVVGSDGEDAVGAEFLQFCGERSDFGGVVATRSGEDRHFALGNFEGDLDDAKMLGVNERGAFASGAAGDEEVDARVDLTLYERAEGGFVERAVVAKWCYECSTGSSKHFMLLVSTGLGLTGCAKRRENLLQGLKPIRFMGIAPGLKPRPPKDTDFFSQPVKPCPPENYLLTTTTTRLNPGRAKARPLH